MSEKDHDLPKMSEADAREGASGWGGESPHSQGDRVDDFEILEEVGRGGMGVVYKVYECSLKRVVALKALNPAISQNPSFARRFRREAVLAANLTHPNIVPVYQIDQRPSPGYFTMEFVQGKSLEDKVKAEGAFKPEEAVRVALQACDALQYAHDHNIVHRDIKPSNILLEDGLERIRITDFGIAQDITGQLAELTTTGGMSPGTPAFMSPEQNLGKDLDRRTDIFSLGMTLFYVLTGQAAYRASNRAELAVAFEKQVPPKPSHLNPEVPEELDGIVLRMIAVNRERRFGSCREVADALRRLVKTPPRREPSRGGRTVLVCSIAACVLFGAAMLIWVLSINGDEPVTAAGSDSRNIENESDHPASLRKTVDSFGQTLVLIPSGRFSPQGIPALRERKVTLSMGFWIGEREVTWQLFLKFAPSARSRLPVGKRVTDPVTSVSWEEAKQFCTWMSEKTGKAYGLPTEAQWEYAASVGGTKYLPSVPRGDAPNHWGLVGTSTGVWEWCLDTWQDGDTYASDIDPVNMSRGRYRVIRGGADYSGEYGGGTKARHYQAANMSFAQVGFRLVREVTLNE